MPRAPELSEAGAQVDALDVIVGIVRDSASRVLIGQRPEGKHMAGFWEFPGGKLLTGEPPLAGLKRELYEELGIVVGAAEPFLEQTHRYPERAVKLDIWWILDYAGEARSREGQRLRWVDGDELAEAPLLPADAPIVAAVRKRLALGNSGAIASKAPERT
ncbi:MAG TPA: NUDIX domain-containing protein [Gammaproteobacteria bacterium]|nr:NUDIX domain-containing protein [Gammaproteobacteria bacterium]